MNVPNNTLNVNVGVCGGTTTLDALNLDMVEINSAPGNPTPSCVWGNGSGETIWAAGITGATCGGNNYSGITADITQYPGQRSWPLPWQWTNATGQYGPLYGNQVNYIDVATGVFTDNSPYGTGGLRYFVLAVYETGGEIYLDHYNVDIDYAGGAWALDVDKSGWATVCCPTPPPPPAPFLYHSNNGFQLSTTAAGTASYPNIDLIYSTHDVSAGRGHEAIGYVITWQQGTGASAEIWGADGPLSVSGQNNPQGPNHPVFYIADGKYPDVIGVTAAQNHPINPPGPNKAYVTFLNQNGTDVELYSWDYNATPPPFPAPYPVTNLGPLNSPSVTNPDEFQYPRIAGPQYYDYAALTPPIDEPVAVVAVSENDAASNYKINTFAYHHNNGGTPYTNQIVDASDYMGNGFNGNGYQAIKPNITGIGTVISAFYPTANVAYTDYPTMFYSDYTNDVNLSAPANSGDFYAFGTAPTSTSPIVNLGGGTDYYETNYLDLTNTSALAYGGTEPVSAIATSNNSGFDLLVGYFDGTRIYKRHTKNGASNMPYAFKPGKETSIEQINGERVAIYPNPVSTQLNITRADGADYTLMDMTGRVIGTGTLTGNKAAVNTASLAAGMYIINISKDGHSEKLKFTKQ